jgi:hypothetical protein
VQLDADSLKRLLVDPRLRVTWWGSVDTAEYPVNVDLAARAELPVVPGGATPDERMLLAYYQGRISLAELYRPADGWEDDEGDLHDAPVLDSRVDTTRIQSYLMREFVESLQGIRDDLHAASSGTEASMRVALTGPVSPVALARHVKQAAASAARSPAAAGFQLAEIAACLQEAANVNGAADAWRTHVGAARSAVQAMLDELTRAHPETLGSSIFQRYVRTVLGSRRSS